MKYKVNYQKKQNDTTGGGYWQNANFNEHVRLTQIQPSFRYIIKHYSPPLNTWS